MATNRQKPARERRHRKGLKIQLPQLSALDRRTRACQLMLETRARFLADLGGEDNLSAMQIELADRAATIAVILSAAEAEWLKGEPLDLGAYTTAANTQNRLLTTLGLKRVARDISLTLEAHLANRAAPSADQAAA